ncbi:hypothetical protein FJZ48_03710, partial [Candidatus Uhrbacteria bacterium]|nr:hypothetical protein [Candidatus Uhrbacteria bacterium]
MDETRAGLLRALAFFDVVDYSPTRIELVTHFDVGEKNQEPRSKNQGIDQEIQKLEEEKIIQQSLGRFFFSGREHLVTEHEKREALFPRKLRRARNVVRWLRRLGGVCFVALCNTTALAHAGEKGDLDFFIVTKAGTIWQTRGWSALPLQLFKLRPGDTDRDPVCLSFFVDNTALNLRPLHMGADDVYFRHWFLSLLP